MTKNGNKRYTSSNYTTDCLNSGKGDFLDEHIQLHVISGSGGFEYENLRCKFVINLIAYESIAEE